MEQKPMNKEAQQQDNITKPVVGQNFADKKNLKKDQSEEIEIETDEDMESDEDLVEDGKH